MVMSEMGLSRIEELPHTIALELRPTLAIGDPAVLFVDRIRPVLGHLRLRPAAAWLGPMAAPSWPRPETCQFTVGGTFPERCQSLWWLICGRRNVPRTTGWVSAGQGPLGEAGPPTTRGLGDFSHMAGVISQDLAHMVASARFAAVITS